MCLPSLPAQGCGTPPPLHMGFPTCPPGAPGPLRCGRRQVHPDKSCLAKLRQQLPLSMGKGASIASCRENRTQPVVLSRFSGQRFSAVFSQLRPCGTSTLLPVLTPGGLHRVSLPSRWPCHHHHGMGNSTCVSASQDSWLSTVGISAFRSRSLPVWQISTCLARHAVETGLQTPSKATFSTESCNAPLLHSDLDPAHIPQRPG